MAKSPRCQYSYAGRTRLAPPAGLCRSRRLRSHAFRVIQPWQNPRVAGARTFVSNGWRHPWVCGAVSGCSTSSLMNSRVPCNSAIANHRIASSHTLFSNGWRHPWVCAAVSGCGASAFRVIQPWRNPGIAGTHTLVLRGWRHPWACAAVSGCGIHQRPGHAHI